MLKELPCGSAHHAAQGTRSQFDGISRAFSSRSRSRVHIFLGDTFPDWFRTFYPYRSFHFQRFSISSLT